MAAKKEQARQAFEEELPCTISVLDGSVRNVRYFPLKELEAMCARIRKHGGAPSTPVRIMRDAANGDLRLFARIEKK